MCNKSDIGVFGLGVMGGNLAINLLIEDFSVSVYNRLEVNKKDIVSAFLESHSNKEKLSGYADIHSFISSLSTPRKIILMIKSGAAIDDTISKLIPLICEGDIIIDCGNSHYLDTVMREKNTKKYGIHYLGCGISGGWRGARSGPSIMAGGSHYAWSSVKDSLQKISAKNIDGKLCCDWLGDGGSGHLVKMVHNGIEYAMMQSIAEAYDLMYRGMGLSNDNISSIFSEWNNGVLNSYLVKITSKVLRIKKDGMALIDSIVDKSMQKGTGKDFAICAFKYDIAAPTITEAVNARFLSNVDRGNLSKLNSFFLENNGYDNSSIIECIQDSIYCSYVASIIQGFDLIRAVSSDYSWNIDAKKVFSIWSEGCIIKSSILDNLSNNINENNLLDLFLQSMSKDRVKNLRSVVLFSSQCGVPVPVGSATLAYYLGVSSEKLPSNLIQLQREYFGSHGFEIFDKPGVINHLNNEDI